MSIILFAMIGAAINAGMWYWICFGGYCAIVLIRFIDNLEKIQK